MSKWSVTIHQSNRNGSSSPKCRWVVDPPGYNHKNRNWGDHRWHVAGGKWFAWGSEVSKREAWEEALAYADQRARTIEVTLPRYPLPLEIPGEEGDTTIVIEHQSEEDSVSIKDDFQDDTILLRRFELQPVALALLAEAQYGEEACPR